MLTGIFVVNAGFIALRRRRQIGEFHQRMLVIHLASHEGLPEATEECRMDHLHAHLRWHPDLADQVVARAERQELVERSAERLWPATRW